MRKIKAVLKDDATLEASVTTVYSCMQQDELQMLINALSKDKVKEILHEQLDFATYEIERFNYKENKSKLPSVNEELNILVSNYATITGKRLFIVPNIMTRQGRRLTPDENRKFDIELEVEYTDVDTAEISIPAGYTTESVPPDMLLDTKFGRYRSSVKIENNRILYFRSIEHLAGKFPAKDYPELVKFYDAMYKADRAKLVLVKTEQGTKGF